MNAIGQRSNFIKFVGDSAYPKCNIRVDKTDLVFDVAIPYYSEEDIKISVEDNVLSISGSTKVAKDDEIFVVREIPQRTFERSWKLPSKEPVAEKDILAECKNGLLTVRVKNILAEEQPKKKLEIKLTK
jgi:HSP20 family molecular chaperone IbpA